MRRLSVSLILLLLVVTLLPFIITSCNNLRGESDNYSLDITSFDTGTDISIRALYVVNDKVVWASGSGGTFLLTTDGGQTWKKSVVPDCENNDFRSLHAWNPEDALLFGTSSAGRGYITSTAGENWEVVYENGAEGIFFNSVSFADDLRGIALSDPIDSVSFVIRTIDGGLSWERITGLPVLDEGEFHFAASNSCIDYHSSGMVWIISGGGNARVFRSDDHGLTWSAYETGIFHGTSASGIFSVSFLNDNDGVIVGGTYDNPSENFNIAAYSTDGGITWNLSEQMPTEYRSNVIWLNDNGKDIILATGKTGCDLSTDMGHTWSLISDEGYYTACLVPGTMSGFFAGSDGRIARFEIIK